MAEKRWIAETLFDDLGFRMSYQVDKVLYEMQTEHQHLVLFEHKLLRQDADARRRHPDHQAGRVHLSGDDVARADVRARPARGKCSSSAAATAASPRRCSSTSRVKRLTQVEIDASVVEFSKEHFPEFTKPVFADKRFESVIDDGMKYVARTDRRFDVIIVDSTDPQGPGKVLFSTRNSMPPASAA